MELGMMFTHFLAQEDDCREWYEWFEGRGIPAAIVGFRNKYAVFRKGKVKRMVLGSPTDAKMFKEIECPSTPIPDRFLRRAVILDSCNGYTNS